MAKKIHRTMIGGQAVIEGVMMRGVDKTALAVRKPDGDIELEVFPTTSIKDKHSPLRIPIIRGVINFVEMLIFGYKTLMKSAEIAGTLTDTPAAGNPGEQADKDNPEHAPTVSSSGEQADKDSSEHAPAAGSSGEQADEDSSEHAPAVSGSGEQSDGDSPEHAPAVGSSGEQPDGDSPEHAPAVSSSGEQPDGDSPEHAPAVSSSGEEIADDISKPDADSAGNVSSEKKADDSDSGGLSKVAMDAVTVISLFAGFVLAIVLFVIAPTLLVGKTDQFVHWGAFRTIAEGLIKILIFIAYLALIARMEDIQRVYQYHGAEHKTIYCYEHGDELTPENARKYTRFHPRCGTSFLLIVLIVSIIVFSFVTWKTLWLRIILKLVLLPVVVGISYEIIKFAGRHDNSFMRFILAPGLWLQRLTTREPDDSQLEVAIKSIKAVLTENPEDDRW